MAPRGEGDTVIDGHAAELGIPFHNIEQAW